MLTRRAKVYSSSWSQTVNLSPAITSQFILRMYAAAENRKNQLKTHILVVNSLLVHSLVAVSSFKLIDVNTTEKLVISACCGRQHIHAYLQPF